MNKGIYFASFTAFLWGFLAIAIKMGVNILPSYSIAWVRFFIAAGILVFYYIFFDRPKLSIFRKPPLLALIAGIGLGFNYLGYIMGIEYTSPSIGQVFIQAGPVMLATAGFVFFKEKVSVRQGIGLALVVVGSLVFYNEQILNIAGGLSTYKTGVLLVLFGALSWTVYAIAQKVTVKNYDPMQVNLIIFGLPALCYTPFVEFKSLPEMDLYGWLLMAFLGLNTLLAYGSLAYALKYLEANKISVIITLNPIITFVIMAILSHKKVSWIQHETFTVLTIIGALIVLCGVIMTVVKRSRNG